MFPSGVLYFVGYPQEKLERSHTWTFLFTLKLSLKTIVLLYINGIKIN